MFQSLQAIARAMRKATAAATPPINVVWNALRRESVPVNRPLMNPNTPKATRVIITDTANACGLCGKEYKGPEYEPSRKVCTGDRDRTD